ncbi:MAG: hypothetical protein CSA52_01520 [Gammaproteobacteria bacterium]|nr:MAG: hypothetical protein CSB48_09410 [Pseudomonadota bacterium]PIE38651.1 MAG: hypothetical protein CSA52_01520 [Gammaproteobacteria bacterium]
MPERRCVSCRLLLSGFFLCLLSAQPVLAYQKGEKVDTEILQKLNIDPQKITVVDFFASWCTSCKKEIPILDAMPFDENKVELLGVSTDKKLEKGKAFQKRLNIQFRVYDDTSQEVVAAFAPFGMPAIYILKDGEVKNIHFGAMPKIDRIVQKDINKLLEE